MSVAVLSERCYRVWPFRAVLFMFTLFMFYAVYVFYTVYAVYTVLYNQLHVPRIVGTLEIKI